MIEKKSSVNDLFSEVPLSEPLKTYKDNVEALDVVAAMSLKTALTKELKWGKVGREIVQSVRDLRRSREESKSKIDQLEGDKTITAQDKELIESLRECIHKTEDLLKDYQSMSQSYLQLYNSHRRQRETIMPMVFVYLIAIWDAFIFDTMCKIIRLHPNSISDYEKMMRLIRLTKWNVDGE